jgi:hypothetical protein
MFTPITNDNRFQITDATSQKDVADWVSGFPSNEKVVYIHGLFDAKTNAPIIGMFTFVAKCVGNIPTEKRPVMHFTSDKKFTITDSTRTKYSKINMWDNETQTVEVTCFTKDGETHMVGMVIPVTNFPLIKGTKQFNVPLKTFIAPEDNDKFTEEELETMITMGEQLIHLPKTWATRLHPDLAADMSAKFNQEKLAKAIENYKLPADATPEQANCEIMHQMLAATEGKDVKKHGRAAICGAGFFPLANGTAMCGVTAETFHLIGGNVARQAAAFSLRFMYDAEFNDFVRACLKAGIKISEAACHGDKTADIDTAFGTFVPPRLSYEPWETRGIEFFGAMGNGMSVLEGLINKTIGAPTTEMPFNEDGSEINLAYWNVQIEFIAKKFIRQ